MVGSGPGTTSTGHVSLPTVVICLSASHLATSMPMPGAPVGAAYGWWITIATITAFIPASWVDAVESAKSGILEHLKGLARKEAGAGLATNAGEVY